MYRLYHEIPQGLENIASIYKEVAASELRFVLRLR